MNRFLVCLCLLLTLSLALLGCSDDSKPDKRPTKTDTKTVPTTTDRGGDEPYVLAPAQFEQAVVKLGAGRVLANELVGSLNACTGGAQADPKACIAQRLQDGENGLGRIRDDLGKTVPEASASAPCGRAFKAVDEQAGDVIDQFDRGWRGALDAGSAVQLKTALRDLQLGWGTVLTSNVGPLADACLDKAGRAKVKKDNPSLQKLL
jgi:hypothetical protein